MDTPTPYTETTSSRRIGWLTRRWPTALALAASAVGFGDGGSPESVAALAHVLPVLPLLYLTVSKLGRRQATWPGLVIGVVAVVGLRLFDVIPPAAVFAALALVILLWAVADGQMGRDGDFRLQALGMFLFGGFALAGLIVDVEFGRYLVAAGWFLHGVWDFVHLKRDKVVARSFAEWCGVVDVVIAAQLVFMV
ncbi:hypothetical protein [Herbidospora yilanensis]|uniref:hypothetical protein n=1 Tax=Herbidospora yilanensis TaxID=354426 RepID=UPI0007806DA7|nr:hypothetical protein [Herbidospora yilanensis]